MATLTRGASVITPYESLTYLVTSEIPAIEHRLLSGLVSYTLLPALPRAGSLSLVFITEATAIAALAFVRALGAITYADPLLPSAGMVFIVAGGSVTLELDPDTSVLWRLTVPFREVI